MPPLLTGGRACVITRSEPAQKPEPEAKPKPTSLLLESPVRSGSVDRLHGRRRHRARLGRLGAEIVAGGSIHIYGTLRGRAMAGVNGNSDARIYCQKIEAELLRIDGYYQTAEEIDVFASATARRKAWLEGRHHENYPAELTG
jgi:septum site-determining protein MinC